MATDYYAEAREVIQALEAEGRTKAAVELRDVMAAGSTATEVLMGIRWVLLKLRDTADLGDGEANSKAASLIGEIDTVLGPGNPAPG